MFPYFLKIREFWSGLSQNQKITLGSLGAGFVVLMVLVMVWAAKPQYSVLYSNLEPADASQIVDRLRSDSVPYELGANGRTVRVPQARVHEVRLSMAGEGLPTSGTGYELLDTSKLGWTDFVQKFQHRRALEGEIARTVQTLEEIQSARVHLVVPEPSLFVAEEKPATASVVLQMRSGGRLDPGQVSGIVHLVSSSVEGLETGHVTILDANGNLLSSPDQSNLMGTTTDQMSLVIAKEDELTNKVQSLLETVLGPNRAVVRMAVEMDFEQSSATVETFDADNPVVRSEDTSTTTNGDGTTTEAGTTNFEISKRTEVKTSPAGRIKRLTASVFIDGTYPEGADGEPTYTPRTAEEMQKFSKIIETAIGFDTNRGDELTVENIAFDNTTEQEQRREMVNANRMRMLFGVLGKVSGVAMVGAIFFFLFRYAQKSRFFHPPEVEEEAHVPADEAVLVPTGPTESELLRDRLVELARARPETISRLIRNWMREEMH